jgi:hypothetical protein
MAIKYTNIFHCKTLQNLPKFGFLFENRASGNPECDRSGEISLFGHIFLPYIARMIWAQFSSNKPPKINKNKL